MAEPHRWHRRTSVVSVTALILANRSDVYLLRMSLVVPALILASGKSTRMGLPKALLPAGATGVTFVRRLASTLREGGVGEVIVVGRPDDAALMAEVDELGIGVRYAVNSHADTGQLSSIIAGLNVVDHPGVRGLMATPVDLPLMSQVTVRVILARFDAAPDRIVRPTFHGRHGHPVVFPRALFDELRHADPAQGAKAVLRDHPALIADVAVDDSGVVDDIDDPAAYARSFGRPPV